MKNSAENLPSKYDLHRKNRWIFEIVGDSTIAPFLMKSVAMDGFRFGNKTKLVLKLMPTLQTPVMGHLVQWMKDAKHKQANLKFLDPVGTVVDMWTFQVVPEAIIPDALDYDDGAPFEITAVLEAMLLSTIDQLF